MANLIPGVREVRAPLAAGYLWLFAIYLAFAPAIPSRADATGAWDSLQALEAAATTVGVGLALSFAAYLVGSVSEALRVAGLRASWHLSSHMRDRFSGPSAHNSNDDGRKPPGYDAVILRSYSDAGLNVLDEIVTRKLAIVDATLLTYGASLSGPASRTLPAEVRERVTRAIPGLRVTWGTDGDEGVDAHVREMVIRRVTDELTLVRTNLLGREPELFTAVDRVRSASEFRAALAIPLAALAAALVWRATWWLGALVLAAAIVLVAQGLSGNRQSTDNLIELLRLGRTTAPSLERIDMLIAELDAKGAQSRQMTK